MTTIKDRAQAYQTVFRSARGRAKNPELSPPALIVLRDLMRICYANKTTLHANPSVMSAAEGRRQVWMHVARQLSLTEDQLHQLTNEAEPLL